MGFRGDGYKQGQQQAKLATKLAQPTSATSVQVFLGINAFKRANPGISKTDILAYKKGAWDKFKEISNGSGIQAAVS